MTWRVIVERQSYETNLEELKQWVREGRILPTDQVFQPRVGWVAAGQVLELQPLFSPGESPRPPSGDIPDDGTAPSPYASSYTSYAPPPKPYAPAYGQVAGGYLPETSIGHGGSATLLKRFLSYVVDQALMWVCTLPGLAILRSIEDESQAGRGMGGVILMYLGPFAYWLACAYMLNKSGASPGKKVFKLVVVRDDGNYLSFGRAILREMIKAALLNFCFFFVLFKVVIWFFSNGEYRQLYDKLVGANVYEAS
ncbi:MAG: RDD family protein [Chloracidobacterium sp.]